MVFALERVIYISRATPAAESLLGIAEILGQAKPNNDQLDVTGALAIGDGVFLQVLEGRTPALDSLVARLSRDPRYTGLRILARNPITARRFAGSSMKGPLASLTTAGCT